MTQTTTQDIATVERNWINSAGRTYGRRIGYLGLAFDIETFAGRVPGRVRWCSDWEKAWDLGLLQWGTCYGHATYNHTDILAAFTVPPEGR